MTHLQQAEALNKTNTWPSAGAIQSIVEHLKEQKQYGLWQVCPKCEGEGKLKNDPAFSTSAWRTCPVCNGARLLVRPEIKNDNP